MTTSREPTPKKQCLESKGEAAPDLTLDGGVPMQTDSPAEPVASTSGDELSHATVQQLMRQYYGRLFPHQVMYRWLVYGNDSKHPQADGAFFQKREFCFTLDGDIFVRYQAFKDGADMETAIKQRCPAKIDIGPVYTCNPAERLKFAGGAFSPVERELVFDVDLTDYDDVRTCGKEGHICSKCWPLMAVAVQILDAGLRDDFGFRNILWVYSGRRGVHCWVCDESARKLSDEQRAAVVGWFGVYRGHENDRAKVAITTSLHPALERAYGVLLPAFERLLVEQRLLEDDATCAALLRLVPDADVLEAVRRSWANGKLVTAATKAVGSSDVNLTRWWLLQQDVNRQLAAHTTAKTAAYYALRRCLHEIVFVHAYPRLDVEVSKKMNHLLKAPFCVHPKTGKVCVPLDPQRVDEFDPDDVPTVHSLLREANSRMAEDNGGGERGAGAKKSEEWRGTAMAECVALFERTFLDGCVAAGRVALAAKARAQAQRATIDF